jgi:hypothetical protein
MSSHGWHAAHEQGAGRLANMARRVVSFRTGEDTRRCHPENGGEQAGVNDADVLTAFFSASRRVKVSEPFSGRYVEDTQLSTTVGLPPICGRQVHIIQIRSSCNRRALSSHFKVQYDSRADMLTLILMTTSARNTGSLPAPVPLRHSRFRARWLTLAARQASYSTE